jgi:thiaminase
MTSAPTERAAPVQDTLLLVAAPVLEELLQHPFWVGLRTGTLPPECLWYFARQDAEHLVPAYARALARCATVATDHPDAALLCSAAQATFGSLPRLDRELGRLAVELGRPGASEVGAVGPAVHGYASFMLAAPLTSFAAGLGGLLPMSWFHLWVSENLRSTFDPGTRYARWIDQYCAHDGFQDYIAGFLNLVDTEAHRCSIGEWDALVDCFSTAARSELAFADAAWRIEH